MNEETHNPYIDPKIEARIVALIMGEASDFEVDELNRLIEKQPELAAFKAEIEATHGLMGDVATGDWVAKDADWKLPSGKRTLLQGVFAGKASVDAVASVETTSVWDSRQFRSVVATVAIALLIWLGELRPERIPISLRIQSPLWSRRRREASRVWIWSFRLPQIELSLKCRPVL